MRVLVATNHTQVSAVDGDCCYMVDGELVVCGPPAKCCAPRDAVG
jgi:hypothetical protein